MKLLLDCDGVLLDWEAGFRSWVTQRLHRPIAASPEEWDLSKWLKVSSEDARELIHEFNHCAEFAELRPVNRAQAILRSIHSLGHELHVISSCAKASAVVSNRKYNLNCHFGDIFESVTCLDLGESKVHALANHSSGAFWVEDNYTNALTGYHLGHEAFMLSYPYNRKYRYHANADKIHWCDDWTDLWLKMPDEVAVASHHEKTHTLKEIVTQ